MTNKYILTHLLFKRADILSSMNNDRFIRITQNTYDAIERSIMHLTNRTYDDINKQNDANIALRVLQEEQQTLQMVIDHTTKTKQ